MRVLRLATHLVTLILLCASIVHPQKPCHTSAPHIYEKDLAISDLTSPLVVSSKDESEKNLLIIADNQEHALTGVPLKSMGLLSELFITSVALRPPLAYVGGRLLFGEALRFGKENKVDLVLHLGDAANISCPAEISSVFDVLDEEAPRKDGKPMWFMAPGNHDGILAGTHVRYQPTLDYHSSAPPSAYEKPPSKGLRHNKHGWFNACLSPTDSQHPSHKDLQVKGILTKGDAIRLYVKRLMERGASVTPLEPEKVTFQDTSGNCSHKVEIADTYVTCKVEKIELPSQGYTAIARICPPTRVCGTTKWVGPFASYIIQKLEVGGTAIILLDTSDYENPTLSNVAMKGGLTCTQRQMLDGWFRSFDRKKVIVAGHHPINDFPKEQQQWIIERSGRYISAHVHKSTRLFEHTSNGMKTEELNIGSMLDYPQQAVIAKVSPPAAMSFQVFGANVLNPDSSGFLKVCEDNKGAWELEPKFYKGYWRGTYVNRLLDSLRKADARQADIKVDPSVPRLKIPDGEHATDWKLLDDALRTINNTEGDMSRRFWACQSYYASKATGGEESLGERIKGGLKRGNKRERDATTGWLPFSPP